MNGRLLAVAALSSIVYFAAAPDRLAHAEQWICEMTETVCLKFDPTTKEWSGTLFSAGQRYVISQVDDTDEYEIKSLGQSAGAKCKGGFGEAGWLSDGLCALRYRFNRISNEFMVISTVGYPLPPFISDVFRVDNTPYMSIGKCSPF